MTDELGKGPDNYFSLEVQETVELDDGDYLQKAYNTVDDSFTLLYRENGRYSSPEEISSGISNEADVDQLVLAGELYGVEEILESERRSDTE